MDNITFTLTVEESNLMLNALAQMPYAQVVGLIGKLREQAQVQLKPGLDQ